jgi:hypothetical protein
MQQRKRVAFAPDLKADVDPGSDGMNTLATPPAIDTDTTEEGSIPESLDSTVLSEYREESVATSADKPKWACAVDQYCLETFPLFSKFNAGSCTFNNVKIDHDRYKNDPSYKYDVDFPRREVQYPMSEVINHVFDSRKYFQISPESPMYFKSPSKPASYEDEPAETQEEAMSARVNWFKSFILLRGLDFNLNMPSTLAIQHQWKYQVLYTIMSYEDLVTQKYAHRPWDLIAIRFLEELLHHGDPIGVFGSVPDAELTVNRAKWREAFKKCAPILLKALEQHFGQVERDGTVNHKRKPAWYRSRRKWLYEHVVTAADMTTAPPYPEEGPRIKKTNKGRKRQY